MSDPKKKQSPPDWNTATAGQVIQMCSPLLDPRQRKMLKSLGHPLKPVVYVGNDGLHEGVFQSIEDVLTARELIKIKLRGASRPERWEAAWEVHTKTGGQVVQMIGNILLVYRAHPDEPQIRLPRPKRTQN